jgi:hypothetical protein
MNAPKNIIWLRRGLAILGYTLVFLGTFILPVKEVLSVRSFSIRDGISLTSGILTGITMMFMLLNVRVFWKWLPMFATFFNVSVAIRLLMDLPLHHVPVLILAYLMAITFGYLIITVTESILTIRYVH